MVLESEVFGREVFTYPDDEQAFAAVHRLLAGARAAFSKDGIERIVGIIVSDDEDSLGSVTVELPSRHCKTAGRSTAG